MNFLTNWKTTVGGILTILLGAVSLLGIKIAGTGPVDPQVALGMITGGFALLFAKDANVAGV